VSVNTSVALGRIPLQYNAKTLRFKIIRQTAIPYFTMTVNLFLLGYFLCFELQEAQLSQRYGAVGCALVLAKSRRLQLGDNIFPKDI